VAECYQAITATPPRLPSTDGPSEPAPSVQASIHLEKALSLAALGRHDEAMLFFDRAVDADPASAQAWVCKGVALGGLGRFAEAVACFDRALALQPRDLDAWLERGRALVGCGRRDAALECFDQVIAMHPWHTAALYEKGATLFFLDRQPEAAAYFAEVEQIEPGAAATARLACTNGGAFGRLAGEQGSELELIPDDEAVPSPPPPPGPAPTFCPNCGNPWTLVDPDQPPPSCGKCGYANRPPPFPYPPPPPPGWGDNGPTI